MGYHWFDVPAYEDLDRKLWMAAKYSTGIGFGMGVFHNLMFIIPRTAMEVMVPLVRYTAFGLGTGIAGTVGIWGAAKFREKDDVWNYVVGGLSTAAFWGLRSRNFGHFFNFGFIIVPMFMFIKATHNRDDYNETFWAYRYPRHLHGYSAWGYQDISLNRHRDPGIQDRTVKY